MTKFSTALPVELAAALAGLLENQPRKELQGRARKLSAGYRARRPSVETVRDEADALAYALTRMPATYAASISVLGRLRDEMAEFAPRSLLDLGCGLGAASFAALAVWPDIESVAMLDRSREFLALARRLTKACGPATLAGAEIVEAEFSRPPAEPKAYDLVVMSYALTEQPDATLPSLIDALWRQTGGMLALIEPGTPRDFQRLMAARARLTALGARILLPCPHDRPCPLQAPDWCHFSVRLPRSRGHKCLKEAEAPYEDEKFSYLVVSRDRTSLGKSAARIIAPPRVSKHGLQLKICHQTGVDETIVAKRDKPRYDSIRKSVWGDSVNVLAVEQK